VYIVVMDKVNLVGTTWIGNRSLLNGNLIGVYASAKSDALMADKRDQWSIEVGRKGLCIVGAFRNLSERSILENTLRHGGSAVWIEDHQLPTSYSKTCSQAFMEGRLMVVSCFWIPRGTYGTAAYCAELVQHLSTRLVMWAPSSHGFMPQIQARASKNGKRVEVH